MNLIIMIVIIIVAYFNIISHPIHPEVAKEVRRAEVVYVNNDQDKKQVKKQVKKVKHPTMLDRDPL